LRHAVFALLVSALALAVVASSGAGGLGELHEDGGFVDAKLGERIESFVGLKLIGTDEAAGTKTYIRRSDTFQVGGAKVDEVTYSFYEGSLYFISVRMTGRENAEAVLATLEQTFGPSIETGTQPNERIWAGGKVFILYDLDPETQRGMAAMTSAPIHARMLMDRSAAPARIDPAY
jgi:hypothetical protein